MFGKIFATVLLFTVFTANANASLIGINGNFEMFVGGDVTIGNDGSVSEINFSEIRIGFNVSEINSNGTKNDFYGDLIPFSKIQINTNPLIISSYFTGDSLWSTKGFEFFISEVVSNSTIGKITGLKIIGIIKHAEYADTMSEYYISGKNLDIGFNEGKTVFH